jgi:hypothetical protein
MLMTFFLFCTGSLLWNVPGIAGDTSERLRLAIEQKPSQTKSRADFIREQTAPGSEVLILSSLSGIYYMESGTTCPIAIPGPTELFLKEDYDRIYSYINSDRCSSLIYDSNFIHSNPHKRKIAEALYKIFNVTAASPDGSIFLLKRI